MNKITQAYIPNIRLQDIFEILIIVFVVYKIIQGVRNTRAMVLLKGLLFLFVFYVLAYIMEFEAILAIFQSLFTILMMALLIVFQPELRKFLEQIGTKNITGNLKITELFSKRKEDLKYYSDKSIVELSKACFSMGEAKTGALIVIEREIPLTEYVETGISVNGDVTSQLLINIFEKNTPLHDGAVVQKGDKIVSATCYLPLSQNPRISKKMGTRHRAAIGVSEVTDAIVLVVSEETGAVSIVINGKIESNITKDRFNDILYKHQKKEEVEQEPLKIKDRFNPKRLFEKKNIGISLLSLFVGVFAWIVLVNVADPLTTVVFEDVPIEFMNTSIIETTGQTYKLLSEPTVDVRVKDKRTIVDSLKKEDVKVVADFTKLSYVNAISLEGYVDGVSTAEVSFISDDIIVVELDSIISKEIPLTVEKIITGETNYYVPYLLTDTDSIILTGGKTKLDMVDRVVAVFDVTNANESYIGQSQLFVYDIDGDIMDNSMFTFSSEKVSATGVGYPIKEVDINVIPNSEVIDNYKISNISVEPLKVKIAGNKEDIEQFNVLDLYVDVSVNVDSLVNNEFVKTVSVSSQLPEVLYLAEDKDDITVTFTFEMLDTRIIDIPITDIIVVGLDETLNTVSFEQTSVNVKLSGEKELLALVDSTTLRPFIDITDYAEGTYNIPLQYENISGFILNSNVMLTVTIAPIEDAGTEVEE